MVIKGGSNGKRQYILPVCNITCLNLCNFFRYPLRRKRLILGRSMELRTPLGEFYNLKKIVFLTVYMHIFEIEIVKYLDIT